MTSAVPGAAASNTIVRKVFGGPPAAARRLAPFVRIQPT